MYRHSFGNYSGNILAIFWQYLNLYLGVPLEPGSPHVYLFFGKDFSTTQYIFPSRGHRPIVDTCANEAIPQWGKHDLISHVYLLIFGIDMVINKCLVDFLWVSCWNSCCFEFAWNNHYHELGTERAISLIQVCNLWWMSDKVPQGRGVDPVQLLSRRKYDSSNQRLNLQTLIW